MTDWRMESRGNGISFEIDDCLFKLIHLLSCECKDDQGRVKRYARKVSQYRWGCKELACSGTASITAHG